MGLTQVNQQAPEWIWQLSPLLFLGVWMGVCHLLALAGGWKRLAETYPPRIGVTGKRFAHSSGQMGFGVNYNGCLTFIASPSCLRVSIWFVFRPGHAPFCVPWGEITATARHGRFFPSVVLSFARQRQVELRIPRKLADEIAEASGRQLSIEQPDEDHEAG